MSGWGILVDSNINYSDIFNVERTQYFIFLPIKQKDTDNLSILKITRFPQNENAKIKHIINPRTRETWRL